MAGIGGISSNTTASHAPKILLAKPATLVAPSGADDDSSSNSVSIRSRIPSVASINLISDSSWDFHSDRFLPVCPLSLLYYVSVCHIYYKYYGARFIPTSQRYNPRLKDKKRPRSSFCSVFYHQEGIHSIFGMKYVFCIRILGGEGKVGSKVIDVGM